MYKHNGESWEALWRDVCGEAQWKDRIAALEVKSKMFGRVRNEDPAIREINTFHEPEAASDARLWHRFEVWVTFKSDS
jgi:hypothetical protein